MSKPSTLDPPSQGDAGEARDCLVNATTLVACARAALATTQRQPLTDEEWEAAAHDLLLFAKMLLEWETRERQPPVSFP